MSASKVATQVVSVYLALAGAVIAFDYWQTIYPPGDGRWVGMLSALVTVPTCFVVNSLAVRAGSARAGESATAFLWVMSLSALLNAAALFAILGALSRSRSK